MGHCSIACGGEAVVSGYVFLAVMQDMAQCCLPTRIGAFNLAAMGGVPVDDRLVELPAFGDNPKRLRDCVYVPETFKPGAALVLNGCTQTVAAHDHAI